MARAWLAVALPGHSIGLLALVFEGEAVLLEAQMDEVAHQAAAQLALRRAAQALRAQWKQMALPVWLKLARRVSRALPQEQLLPVGRLERAV